MRRDRDTLKLHVAPDGGVWYAAGAGPPTRAGCDADRFVDRLTERGCPHQRLTRAASTAANARLLVRLYDARSGGQLNSVETCSPLAVRHDGREASPTTALCQLRQWGGRRPSQGGWRELTADDYPTLMLAAVVAAGGKVCPKRHRRHILDHPAWPYLSFISGLDLASCFTLVATIIDPRSYVDPDHPDRGARLESFLGLRRRRLRPHVTPTARDQELQARYRLAVASWKAADVPPAEWSRSPGCFLWRTWRRYQSPEYADLRASQRFVSYLRHAWLGSLYAASAQAESLFAADHFFSDPAEAAALQRHLVQQAERRLAARPPEGAPHDPDH